MIDKRDAAPESRPEHSHLARAGAGWGEWLTGSHSTSLDRATAIRGPAAPPDRQDPRTRSRAGRPAVGGVCLSECGLPLRSFLFSGSDGVPPTDGLDEEIVRRTGGGHGDGRWQRGAGLRRPGLHEVGGPGHRCRVHESVPAQLDGCSLTGAHLPPLLTACSPHARDDAVRPAGRLQPVRRSAPPGAGRRVRGPGSPAEGPARQGAAGG